MLSGYRRQIRKDRRQDDNVPLSAFADIAFLLIIFFILTTTFVKTKGMTTEIPSGEKSKQQAEQTPTIKLTSDRVQFNDKYVQDFEELAGILVKMDLANKEDQEKRIILIEADSSVTYQNYYQTMITITQSGGFVSIVREDEKKN